MADDAVSSLLQQYYGMPPETLGGDVQPRVPRYTPQPQQLGQHNLIDSALAAPGQPTADALQRGLQGLETPQGVALSFLENGPMGPLGMARIPNPIRAFHGSPHQFEQFDPAHIGKGEGAQAYGHGLYFAESEGVARNYRDTLTVRDNAARWNAIEFARGLLAEHGGDLEKAIGSIGRSAARDVLLEARRTGHLPEAGAMYEVNLHAQPGQFLDWDTPLSQQSGHVHNALSRINYRNAGLDPDVVADALAGRAPLTGQAFVRALGARDRMFTADSPAAATTLNEAGIPGLRYLDQGSRHQGTTGTGTSNYVVFNPEIIEILRRYGIAAPVTAASVLSQYGGDQQ